MARRGGADSDDGSLLQHSQQLHLSGGGQFPDLVQEQGAAVRRREVPGTRPVGAGERALLVAEQLRLHQLGRQRAAVDGDERTAAARARLVDGARHQLLAGSGLSFQKNGHGARRHATSAQNDALHDRAPMDDLVELGSLRGQTGAQTLQLTIGLTEQVRQEVRRDVEGDRSGADSMLSRRLDHRRGKPRLRQDDPDRGHGRCAWAQVKGERGAPLGGERLRACPHRRAVDLAELGGAGELLREQADLGAAGTRLKPADVRGSLVTVIGEQQRGVEPPGIQGLSDRTDAGRVARFHGVQVRMTDPSDENLVHSRDRNISSAKTTNLALEQGAARSWLLPVPRSLTCPRR